MRYEEITLIITALFVIGVAIAYRTNDYVPTRIRTFCQAKHEVYNDSYDECIKSYKEHQK